MEIKFENKDEERFAIAIRKYLKKKGISDKSFNKSLMYLAKDIIETFNKGISKLKNYEN